jgi:hypothetical protein
VPKTLPALPVLKRPRPPVELLDPLCERDRFLPAPDVTRWLREVFILPGGPLHHAEHGHLDGAEIGVLWTNAANTRQGNVVAGTAEIPKPPSHLGKWTRARLTYQLEEWFGCVPDFLITLSAPLSAAASDLAFCGLAKHELCHCAQATDEWGMPRFRKDDGRPIFTIRGHDVEEHVSVVREFGPYGLINPKVRELVEVAQGAPRRGPAEIALACGTCLR